MFTREEWFVVMTAVAVGLVLASASLLAAALPSLVAINLGNNPTWLAARSSGMIAYLLATASVLAGMATSMQLGRFALGKGTVADVHRSLSLLTLVAIGAHVVFLALDQFAAFSAREILIPFVSWYRPAWTGLGIVSLYLAVALYVSFYLRSFIGYKAWRAVHYATFLMFVLSTAHGLFAGSDSGQGWAIGMYAGCAGAVAVAAAVRFAAGISPAPTKRRAPLAALRPVVQKSAARSESEPGAFS